MSAFFVELEMPEPLTLTTNLRLRSGLCSVEMDFMRLLDEAEDWGNLWLWMLSAWWLVYSRFAACDH